MSASINDILAPLTAEDGARLFQDAMVRLIHSVPNESRRREASAIAATMAIEGHERMRRQCLEAVGQITLSLSIQQRPTDVIAAAIALVNAHDKQHVP